MLTRPRAAALALVVSVGGLLPVAGSASADPVSCQVDPFSGKCVASVEVPGGPGKAAPAPGGGPGGGAPEVCTSGGKTIPCSQPAGGYWVGSQGCYASDFNALGGAMQPPAGQVLMVCVDNNGKPIQRLFLLPKGQTPPPPPDPRVLAQQAVSRMGLRAIQPGMAPPPGPGKYSVIGLPTWMWVADPGPQTTGPQTQTASAGGWTVTATATLSNVTWDMGDGEQVQCGRGTPYTSSYGRRPSPDCGHLYEKSGDYTVTATSRWVVTWQGIGQTGTIPLQFSRSVQVSAVELQAIGQK